MSLESNGVVATQDTNTDAAGSRNGNGKQSHGRAPSTSRKKPSQARKPKRLPKVVAPDDISGQDGNELVDDKNESSTTQHQVTPAKKAQEVSTSDTAEAKDLRKRSSGDRKTAPTDECPTEQSQSAGKPEKYAIELTTEKFIELLRDAGIRFFHDQHRNAFSWIPTVGVPSHFECLPIGSQAFKARVMQLAETYSVKQPPEKMINEVIGRAKSLAFREPVRELANRYSSRDEQIAIDLGDPDWKMVGVTSKGWEMSEQTEAIFFRPQHMKALPEPIPGGDPFELFEFIPVDSEDDKLLILSWTVSAFYPDVPSPILAIMGIQGSAKTTRSRQLRDLTDPSVTPVLGDIELSDLFLTFQHHAVPCLENVSKFSRREADMFCRAVTGNGVERRKLFTNSDQALYSFRRPIIINGIDMPSTRPDFLDRCIVINCQRIKSFRLLRKLDEAFQEARPRLFGALLDLLARTLKLMPEIPPSGEFRMADFAHFGRALTVALGRKPEDFDKAYRLNIRHRDKEALDATPMTNAVKSFANKYPPNRPWTGSAQRLLSELRDTAHKNGDKNVVNDLPKSARWLSSRLSELVTALATEGVIIDRLSRTSSIRGWSVFMTDEARAERERHQSQPDGVAEALDEADAFHALESCQDSSDESQQPE